MYLRHFVRLIFLLCVAKVADRVRFLGWGLAAACSFYCGISFFVFFFYFFAFLPAHGKVLQRSCNNALTEVQIIFKGLRCHTRELHLLLSLLLFSLLFLFDPCQCCFDTRLTRVSVFVSLSAALGTV